MVNDMLLKFFYNVMFILQFLTTVIPYHATDGPPTSEQLQIYIKSKFPLKVTSIFIKWS